MKSWIPMGVLLSGCVSYSGVPGVPIEDYDQRYRLQDLSVLPPHGSDWFHTSQGADFLLFQKGTGDVRHSVSAMLYISDRKSSDMEDLLDLLKVQSENEGSKYRLLRSNLYIDREGASPRVVGKEEVEDLTVPQEEGKPYLIEKLMRVYLHPGDNRQVFLTFSQRHPRGQEPLDLDDEALAFLESLRFDQ